MIVNTIQSKKYKIGKSITKKEYLFDGASSIYLFSPKNLFTASIRD